MCKLTPTHTLLLLLLIHSGCIFKPCVFWGANNRNWAFWKTSRETNETLWRE